MAERTVTYVFKGSFGNLTAGLAAAGRSTADLGTKLTAADRNSMKMRAGLTQLGSTAGKVGLIAAAGFAVAVAAAAKFESAMSRAGAATNASAAEMEELRAAALKAGADTVFSASEAADGITELGKAGLSTADIMGGALTGALDLAAAGQISVAEAAGTTAITLQQFALDGEEATHVADVLAAGAGKAMGSVTDMAAALKYVGPVAGQMGVSLEESAGAIAELASQGVIGEQAGTALRGMLTSLTSPSKIAADQMEALGISLYDAQGQFVGLDGIAGQLQASMGDLTAAERDQALGRIFGNEQITAARILYAGGAGDLQKWTAAVDDSGYAAEQAAKLTDNLAGDLEQLKGSLETAFIGAGTGSQGPLRQLVQGTTDVVNAFNKIPQAGQSAATGLLAVTAVVGGGLWFTSKTVQAVASTRDALDQLGFSAKRTKGALANIGTAAVGIGAIIGTLDILQATLNKVTDSSIDGSNLSRDLEALADGQITDNLDNLFQTFQDIDDGWQANANPLSWISSWDPSGAEAAEKNIKAIDEALASMVETGNSQVAADAFDNLAPAAEKAGLSVSELRDLFPEYGTAISNASGETATYGGFLGDLAGHIIDATRVTQDGEEATSDFGVAARQAAEASQAEADALEAAMKAMQEKTSATLAGFDAETQYRQALKDALAQGKKNDAGIKGSSEAALNNRAALSGLASAWNNQSAAVKNNVERYKESRKSFIDAATAMGVPTAAAKRLADRILEIPKSRVANVGVNGADAATSAVERLSRALSKVVSKTITLTVNKVGGALSGMDFAEGGFTGPGGVNEPAGVVHKGEVVIPQSLVKRDWSMLKGRYGNLPGFADGGVVGSHVLSTSSPLHGIDQASLSVRELAARLGHLSAHEIRDLSRDFNNLGKFELKRFDRALDVATRAIEHQAEKAREFSDEQVEQLKALKDARRDFARSVTGNFRSDVFGGNIDLAAAGMNGLLGADFDAQLQAYITANMSTGGSNSRSDWIQQFLGTLGSSQIAALQAQASVGTLQQDQTSAGAFEYVLEQLRQMGLTGGAYAELAASGNYAQANAYLQMGPDFIKTLMTEFRDRNQSLQGLGQSVGNAQFGADIREQRRAMEKAVRIAERQESELKEANRINRQLERHLERIERDSPKKTGDEVASVITNAVGHGQRRG